MFIIESLSKIDESAHITGIALIPRISRNDNLYTKEELKRFDNVTVPLNWEHDEKKNIGQVTFHYNPSLETVYYEGDITDEAYIGLAKSKTLFTSIEANPISFQTICNGPKDCFNMPFGLVPEALALTEAPGVPETSVNVIESIIKESFIEDADCVKKMMDHGKSKDQAVDMCYDKESVEDLKKEIEALKKALECPTCHGIKRK